MATGKQRKGVAMIEYFMIEYFHHELAAFPRHHKAHTTRLETC